jgi:hypothetical protein
LILVWLDPFPTRGVTVSPFRFLLVIVIAAALLGVVACKKERDLPSPDTDPAKLKQLEKQAEQEGKREGKARRELENN